ncbi:MAG: hypothetical protein ACXV8Y_16025 [Acidimicrobiia bacterium]
MSSSRFARVAVVAVATLVLGACGSSTKPGVTPTAHRLRLSATRGGVAATPSLYPQNPISYALDGTLADLGRDAPVRRLAGHDATAADLARVAETLGMQGVPTHSATGWELRDGDAAVNVDTSGAVPTLAYTRTGGSGSGSTPGAVGGGASGGEAGSGSTGATPDSSSTAPATTATSTPPVDVPDAEAAGQLARSLLDRLDVLSGQQWSRAVGDASGTVSSCGPNADCSVAPTVVTARTATFTLVLDGVEVPDVAWSVTIGEHRRVESVTGTWATVAGAGTAALRPAGDVFDDLTHGRAHFVGPQPLLATAEPAPGSPDSSPVASIVVHVTGVSLGVVRWDGTEHGRSVAYLLPTYRFHTRAADGTPASDVEVLALDPVTFTIAAPPASGGSGSVVPPTGVAPAAP